MKKLFAKQQVRFLVAGSLNTGLDFLLLNLLTFVVKMPELAANTISVTVGICVSYLLNHFFVFQHPGRIRPLLFLKFFAVTGFSSLVLQNLVILGFESFFNTRFGNSLLLFAGEDGRAIIAINVAKVFAVLLGLVWNFLMYKFVVFRRPADTAALVDPEAEEAVAALAPTKIGAGPGAGPTL